MKKKLLSILLTVCMVLSLLPTVALAENTAWDGTADTTWYNENQPSFTLTTAEQLAGLAVLVNGGDDFYNKTIKLGADIVLNGSLSNTARQWTPIGDSAVEKGFAGTFDGCGYSVSGMYINNSATNQALFGFISARHNTPGGTLRNLGVVNGSVTCSSYGAGLVGHLRGNIYNCYTAVSVSATGNNAAGIVADNLGGSVVNCYNVGTISSNEYVGGIIPMLIAGQAVNCFGLRSAVPGANADMGTYFNSKGYLVGFNLASVSGGNFDQSGTLSSGGTLLEKLNAWVGDQDSSDYYTWKADLNLNDGYPVQNAPYSVVHYAVSVNVNKDTAVWTDSGKTFTLKSNTTSRVVTNLNTVTPGEYSVLDGGLDTGRDVTVADANTSVTLDYYTVSGMVLNYAGGSNTVSGLGVKLYAASDTNFTTPLATATTDVSGNYSFITTPGSYVARVEGVPSSYGAGTANVTVINAGVTGATVTLTQIIPESIAVSSTNHKTEYLVGDSLDVTNLKIRVTMSDGTTKTEAVTDQMVSGFHSGVVANGQTLTITYSGKTTTYTVAIKKAPYSGAQASTPSVQSKEETSVTLTAQTINGETVEYVISTTSSVPESGWKTDASFTGLSSGTAYYFFARVQETPSHHAGTAASTLIRTVQGVFPELLDISNGSITIDAGTTGYIRVTYGGTLYDNLPAAIQIGISGSSSTNTITMNTSCNIALAGISITPAADSDNNAMNITAGTVNLTLADGTTNTLVPQRETTVVQNNNKGKAALRVAPGATLNINGSTGKLTATGGNGHAQNSAYSRGGSGAGIGGNGGIGSDSSWTPGERSGNITINGGVIVATGGVSTNYWGGGGSGIGGGGGSYTYKGGASGSVTINGGLVSATGGANTANGRGGAGIGGGGGGGGGDPSGTTGNVCITGGTVYATGGAKGSGTSANNCGIGTEADADTSSILTITGGSLKAVSGGDGAAAIGGATPTNGSNPVYKATFPTSATVTMAGYTYGGTVSTPTVSQNPGNGTVTYYYAATNSNTGGTKWESISYTTLEAGDYYIYADIAANGNYDACKTNAVKFTVAKAERSAPTAPAVSATSSGSITVASVVGQRYFCQLAGTTAPTATMPGWTAATETTLSFSSLSPNKNYEIYTYIPADSNHNDSAVSAALTAKTASAKVTGVTAPENVILTKYYSTASAVIPELPGAAKATLEGGGIQYLNITWTKPASYNTAPSATNAYIWSVTAPANYIFDGGVTSSGTITVTNKAATPVTIAATTDADKLTRGYAGGTMDVTNLFSIDPNAGIATYSVTPGTDTAGTITAAGVLTVTKAGTFTVKVDTAAYGNYAAGSQSATLTVNKGTGAGTVTIENWTYGDTAKAPVTASDTNGITNVTYRYEGTGTTSYTASATPPANAGSYQVTATFAATDLHEECTAKTSFAIAAQAVPKPTADPAVFIYTSSEQTYTLEEDNRYTISNHKRTNAGAQTVTVELKDKANYVWQNDGTDNLTFNFVIAKAPISFNVSDNNYTYDAAAHKAAVAQKASQTPVIATGKYAVTYKLLADGSGTTDKTDVGVYDIIVTLSDDNFCFAGETDESTRIHTLTDKLTITKNTVTALWKNTTAVYDGSEKSPVLELVGLKTGDNAVVAQLTESYINADTYAVTAELTGTNSENYTLSNPNGTFIIQRAPISFTLSGNSVKKGESVNVIASPSVNGISAALTYWQSGKQVAAPTETGSYDVYAEITNSNYRHAGGTDGTAQKIGVLTIYESNTPTTYTVSFDANGGTGDTASMAAVQAGTVRILPESGFTSTGKIFAGWQYNGKTYQPGERFTQPSSNVTLKALWNDKVYSIGGIVQEGDPVSNADHVVVTLMLGSRQIGQTITGADGKYSFAEVVPGVYNLVANKDGVTQTVMVTIKDKAVTDQTITMPTGKLSSVVEVKAGSPAIVVGDLEKAFTQQDKTDAASKTVELKLTAQAKAADSTNDAQQEIKKKAGDVDLFLDFSLTKTVDGTSSPLDSSPVLLTAIITLPAELQGRDSYTVYRYHGTEVQTLTTTANKDGEKIEVSTDKATLTVYTKNFSPYAIRGITYSGGGGVSNYTLTFEVNGGSAIAALSKTPGTTVDLSACTPVREGYTFAGWYSNATLTKAITSVKLMANTTVYAKWTEKESMPFDDVPTDAYYYDAVLWALDKGITGGTTATVFNPNGICTRAQAVTFLWRAMGSPEPTSTNCPFTDVKIDEYYYKAVLWATEKGITKGTSDITFSPNRTVTRSQTMTFLWRTARNPAADTTNPFADVKADAYYADAVLWAVKEGITSGTSTTTFSPADGCTRAQIVTFLYRYLAK